MELKRKRSAVSGQLSAVSDQDLLSLFPSLVPMLQRGNASSRRFASLGPQSGRVVRYDAEPRIKEPKGDPLPLCPFCPFAPFLRADLLDEFP